MTQNATSAPRAMNIPLWSPCRNGSPQNTGSFAPSTTAFEVGLNDLLLVLQRPALAEEIQARIDRDPVEHDRRDHLVGSDRRLQDPCDPGVGRSGQRGRHDRERDVDEAVRALERRADPDREVGADEVLALPADVEEPAAERERDREAGENQCGRDQERLLEVLGGPRRGIPRKPDTGIGERQPDLVRAHSIEPLEARPVPDAFVRPR